MPPIDRKTVSKSYTYRPVHFLGMGGMGEVWLGVIEFPLGLQRLCAIKAIREDGVDLQAVAKFAREAMIGWKISRNHPNIVTTNTFGQWSNGELYMVLDLEGPALALVLDELRGKNALTRRIAQHTLRALGHLRDHGIVHGDVSGGNIVLGLDGNAKIADFGLSRELVARDDGLRDDLVVGTDGVRQQMEGEAAPGNFVGVVAYAAPEVLDGAATSHHSDLYSCGAVLYELVTGSAPSSWARFVMATAGLVPESPEPLPASTPDDLRALIEALLSARPEDRPTVEQALAMIGANGEPIADCDELKSLADAWLARIQTEHGKAISCDTPVDLMAAAEKYIYERQVGERVSAPWAPQEQEVEHGGANEMETRRLSLGGKPVVLAAGDQDVRESRSEPEVEPEAENAEHFAADDQVERMERSEADDPIEPDGRSEPGPDVEEVTSGSRLVRFQPRADASVPSARPWRLAALGAAVLAFVVIVVGVWDRSDAPTSDVSPVVEPHAPRVMAPASDRRQQSPSLNPEGQATDVAVHPAAVGVEGDQAGEQSPGVELARQPATRVRTQAPRSEGSKSREARPVQRPAPVQSFKPLDRTDLDFATLEEGAR